MEDFRFLEDNAIWITLIAVFLFFVLQNSTCVPCGDFSLDTLKEMILNISPAAWLILAATLVGIYLWYKKSGDNTFLRDNIE